MSTVEPERAGRAHDPLTDEFLGVELSTDDPFPLYARLRATDGLAWNATQGFWVASRHADVMAVSTDPRRTGRRPAS